MENKSDILNLCIQLKPDGLYTVTAPGMPLMVAESLTRDEALGCIASWIYGSRDDGRIPQYMMVKA